MICFLPCQLTNVLEHLQAAILSFITHAHLVPNLEAATLFTVFALFQVTREPIVWMPAIISAVADAMQAMGRIEEVLVAETCTDKIEIDSDLNVGIKIEHASWTWDASSKVRDLMMNPRTAPEGIQCNKSMHATQFTKLLHWMRYKNNVRFQVTNKEYVEDIAKEQEQQSTEEPTPIIADNEKPAEQESFQLCDINLEIPRGALVAVVGAIGSGKSSLLSGMTNEMHRLEGKVTFGGTTSVVPQTPWIMAATIRENILFGQPWDEELYWWAVKEACLEPDLEILEDGDVTEIGEKGNNLSVRGIFSHPIPFLNHLCSLHRGDKSKELALHVLSTTQQMSFSLMTLSVQLTLELLPTFGNPSGN